VGLHLTNGRKEEKGDTQARLRRSLKTPAAAGVPKGRKEGPSNRKKRGERGKKMGKDHTGFKMYTEKG